MAKLFQVGQTALNGQTTAGTQVLLYPGNVLDVLDAPGGNATIVYNKLDGSDPDVITVSSPASTHKAAMNAAGGTTINAIAVTVVDDYGVTKVMNINPNNIHRVIVDRLDGAKSYVGYVDSVKTRIDQLHCTNTLAAILAAANA
jgi:hypothetical protein